MPSPANEAEAPRVDHEAHVGRWRTTVQQVYESKPYRDHRQHKAEALDFYNGKVFTQTQIKDWGDDHVLQFNMFRRVVSHTVESAYAQDPHIRIRAKRRKKLHRSAVTVENWIRYVWEETQLEQTIKAAFKDCFFGNLSALKMVWDDHRQLWTLKLVRGEIVLDPFAYDDPREARWLAERVELPRHRVYQDERFSASAREKIKDKARSSWGSSFDREEGLNEDKVTLWYVYSHVGYDPNEDGRTNKLLVIAEGVDEFLLDEDQPTPYLDHDEFPYVLLRFDRTAKHFVTTPLWKQLKGPLEFVNWCAAYHLEDARKTASKPIGVDTNANVDEALLTSRKHMTVIPITGNPRDAVQPLNIGQTDKTIFESFQFGMELIDKMSGISDIARGEEGDTKSATEAQILQTNASIALRGSQRDLDEFMGECVRKLALASLLFIPAFSIWENPQFDPALPLLPRFLTKAVAQVPQIDPMGMPMVGPDGQPVMMEQLQVVAAEGATEPKRGIDYFLGEEEAAAWPQIPFEEVKCELDFAVEAGSARAGKRIEEARQAEALMGSIGQELKALQLWSHYYELLSRYIHALGVRDPDTILPTKDEFIGAIQQQQQMAMQMQAMQAATNPGKAELPKPPSQQAPESNANVFPEGQSVNQFQ